MKKKMMGVPPILNRLVVLLLLLCSIAATPAQALEGKDLSLGRFADPFSLYNFVLPTLAAFTAFDPADAPEEKILKTIRYVNFFSNPDQFDNRTGQKLIRMDMPWWSHLSYLYSTGNVQTSEQAGFAAMMLLPWLPKQAVRDVEAHSFFEVFHEKQWIIIDPMYDMRYTSDTGQIASFLKIQEYLKGETTALALPEQLAERTQRYLDRFRKENVAKNPNKRHVFGANKPFDYGIFANFEPIPGMRDMDEIYNRLQMNKIDCSQQPCWPVFTQVRALIHQELLKHPERRKEIIADMQDAFIDAILRRSMGSPVFDAVFLAKTELMLGRVDSALQLLKGIKEETELSRYVTSQALYLKRDKAGYNALAQYLADNPYYRYSYWRLNGEFLQATDAEFFSTFSYKSYDLDKLSNEPYQLDILTQ